ncbi:hypothetical protein ACIQBJ_13805 [Kitasatospora sp. NPDC088391]|uniref:hypothetical protein n=1 Tax=Kitasatospora sp. NPDC088391 TaxID=3364074 RepID=UPI0038065A95
MTVPLPVPWAESLPMPDYSALLAVDAKDFTGLPSVLHAPVSELIPELVDLALAKAGLDDLVAGKRFPAGTGDGVVFGFAPTRLPFVLSPLLDVLDEALARYNAETTGPRIRLRASVHVGPLPVDDRPGDGNGTPRNDTHRLLDSRPVKAVLAASSDRTTHLAAIISDRAFTDAVLGGYAGLHPDRCIEVPATVEGKPFAQRAWLYVPSPSGELLRSGVLPQPAEEPERPAEPAGPAPAQPQNTQHVRDGVAVVGDVSGGISYTGAARYRAANQHWGSGDNVSGDKRADGSEGRGRNV